MDAYHVEATRSKKLCQGSFEGRDLVSELPVKFQCFLLGEQRAKRQKLEPTSQKIKLLEPDMAEQRVRSGVWPDVQMLAQA